MAQKWAIASMTAVCASAFASYQSQNEIARFLWPQIPDSATPYPGGILFPDFNRSTPPKHNHSVWGVMMFPIAGFSSYYILKYTVGLLLFGYVRRKYRTGPTTPRWMGIGETLRVFSPKISQCCIPMSLSIPFATFAKVFRDGPGYNFDREFYRTGIEDNAWDFLKFEYPEPERPLLDNPVEILNLIHGEPFINEEAVDTHIFGLENPKSEKLDEEGVMAWYNAQLGIEVEKPRQVEKKWLELTEDYEFEIQDPIKIPNADKSQPPLIYTPPPKDAFAVDKRTPVGRLPHYGVTEDEGLRLPWSSGDKSRSKSQRLSTSDEGLISYEEFFDPHGQNDLQLRQALGIAPHADKQDHGYDIDGKSLEVASKFANLIRGNATVSPKDLDVFALEKRKARDDLNNPWQSFYYHPSSVVGRDIPTNARLSADPDAERPWRTEEELKEEWIKTGEFAKESISETPRRRNTVIEASLSPVYTKPLHETPVDPQKHLSVLQNIPTTISKIKRAPPQITQDIVHDANLNPHPLSPLPGYSYGRSANELTWIYEDQEVSRDYGGVMPTLPHHWFPWEVKGIVKNRHDYYTGRGARYADEPNIYTGYPAYDPNVIPHHNHGLSMSIQEAEDYYTEAQRDDHEYAKKVAGSFQRLYGVPFPQFDEPDLFDENTIKRLPHLERANERLKMQTRYFNSLEERVTNPPLEAVPSLNERRLRQSTSQITRNKFNPDLYRTSNEYRTAWQAKYPALRQLGGSATADQIEYVLSFAAPAPDEELEKKKKLGLPAFPESYATDRYVRDVIDKDRTALTDHTRIFERYQTDKSRDRREFTPRDLLQHEEEHKKKMRLNQPLTEQESLDERKW